MPRTRAAVEDILTRAVLERGAFLACARLDTNRRTANTLVQGWQADLEEAIALMRVLTYSDDDIRAVTERFNVEKAAPNFANLDLARSLLQRRWRLADALDASQDHLAAGRNP